MEFRVYDKVAWHFPEGKGCPSLTAATAHFRAIISWLRRSGLLSEYGQKVVEMKIGEDFSLTSEMLTEGGNKLVGDNYNEWLKTIEYGKRVSTAFWDRKVR